MTQTPDTSAVSLLACDDGFDPIEDRLRANIRSTIETVFNEELDSFLGSLRYGREAGVVKGYRHGQRDRRITGTFGTETISVPRARVENEDGKVHEWRSKALPHYRRLTKTAETLIDWQHQIAARIRWKIQAIRDAERFRAHQIALFDKGAKPTWSESRLVRFDDTIYQNVPTQTIGAFRFKRHLLGAPEAREKDAIGTIWARTTGNVFIMVRRVDHGVDMSGQMKNAL